MKRLGLLFSIVLVTISSVYSQPNLFNYQAIIRDSKGSPFVNKALAIKISILSNGESGKVEYSELHYDTTNQYGLINLRIGNGKQLTGDFSLINWGLADYFLKLEIDETGGSTYKTIGTTQLLSVPYALYSGKANNVNFIPSSFNPLFPDGFDSMIAIFDSSYKVPLGKNLWITSLSWGTKIKVNNNKSIKPYSYFIAPIVIGPGYNVTIEKPNKTYDNGFSGFIIPQKVKPILCDSSIYYVPKGKTLFINETATNVSTITVNGITKTISVLQSYPLIVPEGATVVSSSKVINVGNYYNWVGYLKNN